MQIAPRYGDQPVMRIESFIDDPATPLLRQRTRLATRLADLDDAQWAAPSRCQGWSVQDVVAHLTTTNQFWALSITSARDGDPTRFLDGFDPVAVPAQLVDDARGLDARPRPSIGSPGPTRPWPTPSSTSTTTAGPCWPRRRPVTWPSGWWRCTRCGTPGSTSATSCCRSGWPRPRSPTRSPDRWPTSPRWVRPSWPWSARPECATLDVQATDPDVRVVVEVGPTVVLHDGSAGSVAASPGAVTVTLAGPAVDLVEALSFRVPLTAPVGPRRSLGAGRPRPGLRPADLTPRRPAPAGCGSAVHLVDRQGLGLVHQLLEEVVALVDVGVGRVDRPVVGIEPGDARSRRSGAGVAIWAPCSCPGR